MTEREVAENCNAHIMAFNTIGSACNHSHADPNNPPAGQTGHTNCDTSCLCKLIADTDDMKNSTSGDVPSLDMDEIYQVLGRDVLKSSLLDDIDLYLECDDDNCYVVPAPMQQKSISVDGKMVAGTRIRISFPQHTESYTPTRFQCDSCTKSFTRESLLKDHQFKVHNVKDLFPCTQCAYKGQTHRLLQKHVKRKHCTLSDTQNYIEKNKSDTSNVHIAHETTSHRTEILCADGVMSMKPRLVELCETRNQMEDDFVPQNVQEINEQQAENLTELMQTHIMEHVCWSRNHADKQAGRTVYVEVIQSAASHQQGCEDILTKGAIDVLACQYSGCHTKCSRQDELDAHMSSHTWSFACTWPRCNKRFQNGSALSSHYMRHSEMHALRTLPCTYKECGGKFKTRGVLNEHMKVVHGSKVFACPHGACQKAYSTRSALRAHVVSHTSLYACKWTGCGRKFRDRYNLEMHRMTHSGETRLQCPRCTYTCIQHNSLNWHMAKKHAMS